MGFLFVLPLFVSMYYLYKGRFDLALLNVYLPCALLLPSYYAIRMPHLPPASAAEWALLPLGIALLIKPPHTVNYRRMDLWLVLFLLTFCATEILREESPKDGLAFFASTAIQMFFAYVVGRRLIEPELRIETTKRIVLLLLCLTPAILFEYRMAQNPWTLIGERVFHIYVDWFVQFRGGHARIAACFGHAILAGIVFLIGFLFDSFLTDVYKRDKTRLGPFFSRLKRYHVPAIMLVLFLLMTRSRGPLISAAIGYLIMQIPRFRNIKVGALVVVLVLVTSGAGVYSYFNRYTNGPSAVTMDEEQSSAMYRKELLKNYEPVIEKGGWLGWGSLSRPKVNGQVSIDNDYLLTELSQGKFGLYFLLLMVGESIWAALYAAFTFRSRESRLFAFTLLGALIGMFVSLYTVYLGEQMIQVCFLLLGWSQSLYDPEARVAPKFQFKRIFR